MTIVSQDGVTGKVCKICLMWKELDQFKGNGKSSDKHDHKCRACRGYGQIKHSFVDAVEGKICSVCGQWESLDCYASATWLSDGLHSQCNKCRNRIVKERRDNNLERGRQVGRESYYRNKDARLVNVKEYRLANLEKVREHDRERNKIRYELYPEQRAEYSHARRARLRDAEGEFTAKEWKALCKKFNHTCLCCGKKCKKLSPDHVIPLSRGGSNSIDNIQPLCLTCNLSKATKTIDYRAEYND